MAEFKCEKCDKEFASKEALDMHTESKHPESYKKPLLSKGNKKKIIRYVIIFIFVLLVAGFLYWRLTPPKNAPRIYIEPSTFNFGPVSQANGVVSTIIKITNTGNEGLIINNMDTSCGCTSASIVYKGEEGPRFGMSAHGTNPKGYRLTIPPGDSADLKVYYDPNVHKDLRGLVRRSVSVYSNDPRNKVEEVVISANQVD